MDTLHEDQYTFLIISRSFLLRMRNILNKSCRDKTLIFYTITCFFKSCLSWGNVEKYSIIDPDRLQMTIWRMCVACWKTKATNTQLEYVIFIALPLQQLLHEHTSVLRHTYTAYLVWFSCAVKIYIVSKKPYSYFKSSSHYNQSSQKQALFWKLFLNSNMFMHCEFACFIQDSIREEKNYIGCYSVTNPLAKC